MQPYKTSKQKWKLFQVSCLKYNKSSSGTTAARVLLAAVFLLQLEDVGQLIGMRFLPNGWWKPPWSALIFSIQFSQW